MKEPGNVSDDEGVPPAPDTRSPERRIAVDAGSKYASLFLTTAIGFFLTRFLVHRIGTMFLGLMTLSAQSLQFIGLISSGISLSYRKLATEHYARRNFAEMNAMLSCGFVFALVSGGLFAVASILTVVFADVLFGLQGELLTSGRLVLLISGCAATISIVTGPWTASTFITHRLYLESVADVVATVGAAVSVLLAFRLGNPSVVAWALILCGFRIGARLFVLIPCARRALPQLRISLGRICSRKEILQMTTFGGLNLLAALGYRLYYSSDSIIIANLNELGAKQIFFYAVAHRWDILIGSFIVAFAVTLTPLMTADAAVGNLDRLRETACRGTRYALMLGAFPCAVLGIFARPLLHHWLGEGIAAASTAVLQLIMIGTFLTIAGIVGHQVLFACGKLVGTVVATLAGGVLNIVLSVVLVKYADAGLYGVAAGSVLSLVFLNVLCIPHFTCVHLGLQPVEYLKRCHARPVAAALPLLLACFLIRRSWEPANLFSVFVQFALCLPVYAISAWCIGLTADDRTRLLATAAKAGARLRATTEQR